MIGEFKGAYRFLSNPFKTLVEYEGMTFPSTENAYQAAKRIDKNDRVYFQNEALDLKTIKGAGRNGPCRPDWDDVKAGIMEDLLRQKFRKPGLKLMLLQTGDHELQEGNWWHDVYWGICDGNGRHPRCPGHEPYGENMLGKLLMKIRAELRAENQSHSTATAV